MHDATHGGGPAEPPSAPEPRQDAHLRTERQRAWTALMARKPFAKTSTVTAGK